MLCTDQWDFERWRVEYGFDRFTLDLMVNNEADQIPMPRQFDAVYLDDSIINGRGIFASRDIQKGELIAPARIDRKRTPCGRFTNHSIRPNSMFVLAGIDTHSDILMMATSDIKAGDEILMCYRQAGAQNGNGHYGDDNESTHTIIARLNDLGFADIIAHDVLKQCITGVKLILKYSPNNFMLERIVSGELRDLAAVVGYHNAGIVLAHKFRGG